MLMEQILAIVLPVFGLIGIGYLAAWTRLLSHPAGSALSEFVFVVAIPLLIFSIVATADLSGLSAWRLWLAFFAAFVLCWTAGTILTRRLFGRDARVRAGRRPRRRLRQHDADRHPAHPRRLRRMTARYRWR